MIKNKRVIATIQVRLTSSRLPGKAMLPLAGKPVIEHMIERHRKSKYTDEVVVATTTNKTDDPIAEFCKKISCPCWRGSEEDVLSRVTDAARSQKADIVVQGMADSPLVDFRIVDRLLEMLIDSETEYVSNEIEESFPVGFDARAFLFSAIEKSERVGKDQMYREHAGYYIFSHPKEFKQINWKAEGEMFWPKLRLTLDTKEDYELISAVYDALYPKNNDFSSLDVVKFLRQHPELVAINSDVLQKKPTNN